MSPYERIYRAAAELDPDLNWPETLRDYLQGGFVFSTPDFFIMGRQQDEKTWYVHSMAGDMQKAWSILPWHLPFIAFERVRSGKRELTIVPTETLRRLSHDRNQMEHSAPM